MTLRNLFADWLDGCRHLLAYDRSPRYRRLPWIDRKLIDHRVAAGLLCSAPFRRALFLVCAATVGMHVIAWRLDLVGAPRDLLRAVPLMLSIPWLASARRRRILALLRFRETPHRQTEAMRG
ncbi:MAG: hypothetical protein ACE5G3_12370 [Gammaproteobacteria bacterium]